MPSDLTEAPRDLDEALDRIAALRERLRESRVELTRLRSLFDRAPDTLIMHDAEGRILEFNLSAAAVHGYAPQEFARLRMADLAPETAGPAGGAREAWAAPPLDESVSLVTTHRHREGHEIPMEVLVAPFEEDGTRVFVAIGRDITARKRADAERERVERRIRNIFERAPLAMMSVEPGGTIGAANPAACELLRCDPDGHIGLLGRPWIELVVESEREVVEARLAELDAAAQGHSVRFETRLCGHDAPIWVQITATANHEDTGARGVMLFLEDIGQRRRIEEQRRRMFEQLDELVSLRTEELTGANDRLRAEINERKRAEVELQEAKRAAESASRAKSQFLASMSHELRTPLNAIIGYSEILMEDAEDDGREDEVGDLEKIRNAGQHLLGIINDILDLSKVEAGKVELFFEDVELEGLVRDVCTTIRPLAERGENELRLELRAHPALVHTDVTRLRQILFNLLSNACKFTEAGKVSLMVSQRELERDGERSQWLTFEIADTGLGMKPEQMAGLFRPFTQADASTTRKFGGTGLGLSISERFATMLGGRIEVHSVYGEGSTFTVWIPIHSGEATASRSHPASATPGGAAEEHVARILVVDDDPATRDLLARLLHREGYSVLQASSGSEALDLAESDPPDLITLDVLMPGMDGWAVLSRLKETPRLAGIPVIIVSLVRDRGMAYALGAADFLSKPVEREKLIRAIHRFDHGDPPFRILVVDDEPDARDLLARALDREGWTVDTAAQGLDALDRMRADKPDLVVLDLMMPGMDGFEVLEHVRADPELRELPVVVVTAKDLSEEERGSLSRRVASVMQKGSYSREHLLDCIGREAERVRRRRNA